jgi:hypothetical protein
MNNNPEKSSTAYHKTTYSENKPSNQSVSTRDNKSFYKTSYNSRDGPQKSRDFNTRDFNTRYYEKKDDYLAPLNKLDQWTVKRIKDAQKTAAHLSASGEYKWASDWENYAKQIWGNASKGNTDYIPQPSNLSTTINNNNEVIHLQYTNVGEYKRPIMFQNAS